MIAWPRTTRRGAPGVGGGVHLVLEGAHHGDDARVHRPPRRHLDLDPSPEGDDVQVGGAAGEVRLAEVELHAAHDGGDGPAAEVDGDGGCA